MIFFLYLIKVIFLATWKKYIFRNIMENSNSFLKFFHEKKSEWKNSQYFRRYTKKKLLENYEILRFFNHKRLLFL